MADDREALAASSTATVGRRWFAPTTRQSEVARLRLALADAAVQAGRQAMLLREADHRIKNSLQIVASLARGAARREQDPSAASAVRAVASRVEEVAYLHDLLQLNGGGDIVDLGALLHSMRQSLQAIVAVEPYRIEILVEAEPIETPAALARSVTMMVSELVMNAVRHAFPGDRRGVVRVTAARVGAELCVTVADDGVGLPPKHAEGRGFGMKLVHAMTSQIGGALRMENASGARFTLIAPIPRR